MIQCLQTADADADAVDGETLNGTFVRKSLPDLQVFKVSSNVKSDRTEEGLICQMPEKQSEEWLFILNGDEKKCKECASAAVVRTRTTAHSMSILKILVSLLSEALILNKMGFMS